MDTAEAASGPDFVNEVQIVELAQSLDFVCNGLTDTLEGSIGIARHRVWAASVLLQAVVERAEATDEEAQGPAQSLSTTSRQRLAARARAALNAVNTETRQYQTAPAALANAAGLVSSAIASAINCDAKGTGQSAAWAFEALAFGIAMTERAES